MASQLRPHKERKWLFTQVSAIQRGDLDILRVAASAKKRAVTINEPTARADFLLEVVKDVVTLASDNAQRTAQLPCQYLFEAAGAKGAHSFVEFGPKQDEIDIDTADHNLVQQVHIEAMQDLRKFSGEITPQDNKGGGKTTRRQGNCRHNYRGRGGGGGGRGGGGSWRGGRGHAAGYGANMGRGGGSWRGNAYNPTPPNGGGSSD